LPGIVYDVDDDASFLTAVSRLLRVNGHPVKALSSASEFLEALPAPDRQKFVKALSQIAQAAEQMNGDVVRPVRRNVRRRKLGG